MVILTVVQYQLYTIKPCAKTRQFDTPGSTRNCAPLLGKIHQNVKRCGTCWFNPFAVGRPFCWGDSCKKHLNKKRYWQPKRLNVNSLTTNQSHYRPRTLTSHKLVNCFLSCHCTICWPTKVCSLASVPSSFRKKTKQHSIWNRFFTNSQIFKRDRYTILTTVVLKSCLISQQFHDETEARTLVFNLHPFFPQQEMFKNLWLIWPLQETFQKKRKHKSKE